MIPFLDAAAADAPVALANSRYSADAVAVACAERLLELPDDVTVYPGHGVETTIGAERGWMRQMTAGLA